MWVHRHPLNNSLVVCIHGVFGSRWTWKGLIDYFQQVAGDDSLVGSYDVYLFQYESGWRQPGLMPFVANDLDRFLKRRESDKYDTIVLVCHSQGGLVAKLYVLEELQQKRPCRIHLLVTFGTPHHGVPLATPLLWVQRLPLVGRFVPFQQVGQLSTRSANIRKLKTSWPAALAARNASASDAIRSMNIVGAFDRIVSESSASGFSGEVIRAASHGHPLKERNSLLAIGEEITKELRSHARPDHVFAAINAIETGGTAMVEYVRDHEPLVRQLVLSHLPAVAASRVTTHVNSLLDGFLREYRKHPTRKLDLSGAVKRYAEWRLEEMR
jgi:pimeloyl-ACP methyl ester carboxylesterase